MKVRNIFLSWHRLIGLFLGLLFAIIGLTGSVLVFHEEIDRAINAPLWSVSPQGEKVSVDTMISTVKMTYPDLSIQAVEFPKNPKGSYLIRGYTPQKQLFQSFIDPYTGKLLGGRIWERSLTGFLYTVHYQLFLGKAGEVLVAIVGVMFLIAIVTGIVIWTGWQRLFSGFKIRFHSPAPIINYDLHKVGGILSAAFLLILALTGLVIISFHILPILGNKDKVEQKSTISQLSLSFTESLKKADEAMPDGKTTLLSWSDTQPHLLTIYKKLPNQQTDPFDLSNVEIDRYTGKVLQINRVLEPNPLFRGLIWVARLHFGTFAGILSRSIYVFIGLMPTFLLTTGMLLWRRKQWLREKQGVAIKIRQQQEIAPPTNNK